MVTATPYDPGTGSLVTNGLPFGTSMVMVTNNQTSCSFTTSIYVDDIPAIPMVNTSDMTILNQLICNPDGSVTINQITVNDAAGNPVTYNTFANFNFDWFRGTNFATATPILSGIGENAINPAKVPTIGADTYWFVITKQAAAGSPGAGCSSAPIQAIIKDKSTDPTAVITEPAPQTSCDPLNPNGSLSVTIDGGAAAAGYTIAWEVESPAGSGTYGPVPVANGGNTDVIFDVAAANYRVTITDNATGCSVVSLGTLTENLDLGTPRIDAIAVVNTTDCIGSGSLEVTAISPDPVIADHTFTWFQDTNGNGILEASEEIVNPLGAASPLLDNLVAGTYYVIATNINTTCDSKPVQKTVADKHTDPVVVISEDQPNVSCDPANGTGQLSVTADGSTDIVQYLFEWFQGDIRTNPGATLITQDVTTLGNLGPFTYSVRVTNNITGCIKAAAWTVADMPQLSKPKILAVDKMEPFDCISSTSYIEVTSVSTGPVTPDHTYEWYLGDLTNLIAGVTGPRLDNPAPGDYYIIAINVTTSCPSDPYWVEVTGDSIIYPNITIMQDFPQTSCDPNLPNGQLSATVDAGFDDTNPNYTWQWYTGLTNDPTKIIPGETGSTLDSVTSGDFTLEVMDMTSGCTGTQSYSLQNQVDVFIPNAAASSDPVKNCVTPDGKVSGRVTNRTGGNFTYRWYIGNSVKATPDYVGQTWDSLDVGTYTVDILDNTTSCVSDPATVEVTDGTIIPDLVLSIDQPLTVCDVARPDGQLSATVNTDTATAVVAGYIFDWWNGTVTTGPPDFTGPVYPGLAAGDYTVRVTRILTGCTAELTGTVVDSTLTPPSPEAEVISHQLSCISLIGAVKADVNGGTSGYSFAWYNGPDGSGTEIGNLPFLSGLDAGIYSVRATDNATGCISDPVPVEVLDKRTDPEFDFTLKAAICETLTGSASLNIRNEVSVANIEWTDKNTGEVLVGVSIYDQPPGRQFDVLVTTVYGCTATGEVEIPTDINSFNGISPNGDGENDSWEIACITLFPNNHIEIYNRNGTLVYMADGYNNADVSFDGIGENGAYLIGKDLPDGTYFYIIDKRDGSPPIRGFLELLR